MRFATAMSLTLIFCLLGSSASAASRLADICRVKGLEENELVGLGLVIGLKGTGDGGSYLPTLRGLAAAMNGLGSPLGPDGLVELKDTKNVALVMVSATVPGGGARDGDRLTCSVSSIGAAKSLAGGVLFSTPLVDPRRARIACTPSAKDASPSTIARRPRAASIGARGWSLIFSIRTSRTAPSRWS